MFLSSLVLSVSMRTSCPLPITFIVCVCVHVYLCERMGVYYHSTRVEGKSEDKFLVESTFTCSTTIMVIGQHFVYTLYYAMLRDAESS